MTTTYPTVVIVGAGFGGLYAAHTLKNQPVNVILIDRQNFHTFTPLLYQVATCGLDPSGIAYPVRSIFRRSSNVQFLMGEVKRIDHEERMVEVMSSTGIRQVTYDYLIVAAGSVTNYFRMEGLQDYSFGLKNLADAVILRNHILKLFERAAWTDDSAQKQALTTLVVVGGGPTGLETAGALFELYNHVVRQEYAGFQSMAARVILLEASDHVLDPYPPKLRQAALQQLKSLGVDIMLGAQVEAVAKNHVRLKGGQVIPTYTLVWAAGVKSSPVAEMLNIPLQRTDRVPVQPTLEVIGREKIYVVGDMAYLEDNQGAAYPMLIPVAKQQGILAAKNILRQIKGLPSVNFRYYDRGIMATIGRSRAVAWIFYRVMLTGYLAWLAWLVLHLIWLLGFRNRASVFVNWVWNYITYDRSVRIILEHSPHQADLETDKLSGS
jgi:NADH:quinone reductase (non-electrogenic)